MLDLGGGGKEKIVISLIGFSAAQTPIGQDHTRENRLAKEKKCKVSHLQVTTTTTAALKCDKVRHETGGL